jgi:hypothetical protein
LGTYLTLPTNIIRGCEAMPVTNALAFLSKAAPTMTSGRERALEKTLLRLPECWGYGFGVWCSVRVVV